MDMPQPPPAAGPGPAPERLRHGGGGFSWLLFAAFFAFLTFNSAMAVYHSKGDAAIVAFVATSYLDLVLLFGCIWLYKRAAPGSPQTNRLKASVWTLTTLLTFSFVYMVTGAAGLTLPVVLLVWIIAAATGVGAFTAFFDHGRVQSLDENMLPPV